MADQLAAVGAELHPEIDRRHARGTFLMNPHDNQRIRKVRQPLLEICEEPFELRLRLWIDREIVCVVLDVERHCPTPLPVCSGG